MKQLPGETCPACGRVVRGGRRLLVLGPIGKAIIVAVFFGAALAFARAGDSVTAGMIVAALLARTMSILPVASGRPDDVAQVVRRRSLRTRTNPAGVPTTTTIQVPLLDTTANYRRPRLQTPPPITVPPLELDEKKED